MGSTWRPNAGSAAGQLSVMPRVNGQNAVAQPLVLNVAGDASKAEIRDMTVKVNNQLANGQSANQITLTVVDSYGNPLQGQKYADLPRCDQQDGEYSNNQCGRESGY